jgi:hypothetical protein
MMQSAEEHQVVPNQYDAVIPVRGRKSKLQGDMDSRRSLPEEIVGPGRSWLPPAGRRPAVQQWHSARGKSSGNLGPTEIVDCGRK